MFPRSSVFLLVAAAAAGCSLFPNSVVVDASGDAGVGGSTAGSGGTGGNAGTVAGEGGASGSAGAGGSSGEGGTAGVVVAGAAGSTAGAGAGGSGGNGGAAATGGSATDAAGGSAGTAGSGGSSGAAGAGGSAGTGAGGSSGTSGAGGTTPIDASVSCTAPGVIPNWSFELTTGTSPNQWTRESGTGAFNAAASNSFDGLRSGYIDTTSVTGAPGVAVQTVVSQRVPVAGGQVVAASAYFRNLDAVAGSEPRVVIQFFGAAGTPLVGVDAVLFPAASSAMWSKQGDVGIVAPVAARELRVVIENTAGWRYFVDAVCVQPL